VRELAELAVELAADRAAAWGWLLMVCEAQGDQPCIDRVSQHIRR
jgi:hypothetical protein